MNQFHQPWKLIPSHVRGKGGREIGRFRGDQLAKDLPDGSECWVGAVNTVNNPPADNPYKGCSKVILPDGQRLYLFEAIAMSPKEILGETHMARYGTGMGVLVKFLDAQVQYRLQCHPTRSWAKKMWNSDFGKEESWYIISTREDTPEPAYIFWDSKKGLHLNFGKNTIERTTPRHWRDFAIKSLFNQVIHFLWEAGARTQLVQAAC